MTRSQQMLEENITEAGREPHQLVQLIQDQLDARGDAEQRLALVVGADGVVRRRVEAGHVRLVATAVGRVEVTRTAYRAPGASNPHLADAHPAPPVALVPVAASGNM